MGEALNMDAQTNNDLRRYVVANPLVLIEIVACLDGLLVLASQLMPSLRKGIHRPHLSHVCDSYCPPPHIEHVVELHCRSFGSSTTAIDMQVATLNSPWLNSSSNVVPRAHPGLVKIRSLPDLGFESSVGWTRTSHKRMNTPHKTVRGGGGEVVRLGASLQSSAVSRRNGHRNSGGGTSKPSLMYAKNSGWV
jgi:hypothetical protein